MSTPSGSISGKAARVLIVGGGPAGMMLGYLLARAGVQVEVLEKHEDFFRDFRGDTIHPSTLEILAELGLLEAFLKLPHQELASVTLSINGRPVSVGDFTHLRTRCKFVAFAPQWDFLNFLASQARQFGSFQLRMKAEATELIHEGERVVGVHVGSEELRADLVVAADGRHSALRRAAGLPLREFGAPIDVLWMRVPKPPGAPPMPLGFFGKGHFLVLLDRGDYYQMASLIEKGAFEAIKATGLPEFREGIAHLAPFLTDVVTEIDAWDKVKLLSVRIDRLEQWSSPGLLCIGDAAHAMSPAGGVGINLAIQDAVATANILVRHLETGGRFDEALPLVQQRRMMPTQQTQQLQVMLHRFIVNPRASRVALWLFAQVLSRFRFVGRRIAYTIGVGFLPEHVDEAIRGQAAT